MRRLVFCVVTLFALTGMGSMVCAFAHWGTELVQAGKGKKEKKSKRGKKKNATYKAYLRVQDEFVQDGPYSMVDGRVERTTRAHEDTLVVTQGERVWLLDIVNVDEVSVSFRTLLECREIGVYKDADIFKVKNGELIKLTVVELRDASQKITVICDSIKACR
ncbi:MAG: hypothetical protein MJZ60_09600 [Bacteroidaceae bacterium]|nr:hypothetical protein [Bacteroidaceae bacterium]